MNLIKSEKTFDFNFDKVKNNPYDVLGVSKDATNFQIKKAYRHLAGIYHEDVFKGSKEIFILIGKAKDCLVDPKKRMLYDEFYIFGVNDQNKETRRAAQGQIQGMFCHIIEKAPQLDQTDIKASIITSINQAIERLENKMTVSKTKIKKYEGVVKRISGSGKKGKTLVNLLKCSVDISIDQERAMIAKIKNDELIFNEVLSLLDEFECTFKDEPTSRSIGTTSTATSFMGYQS